MVPDKVPWSQVSETLSTKFRSGTGRSLTEGNLRFLAAKAFRNPNLQVPIVGPVNAFETRRSLNNCIEDAVSCVIGRERATADVVAILQRTVTRTKLHFLGMVLRFDEAHTRAFTLPLDRRVSHLLPNSTRSKPCAYESYLCFRC